MFIELLRKRRSIRKFSGAPLDETAIGLFTETLLRSPTSRGVNHREFVFITDRDLLDKLSRSKKQGTEFIAGASLGIVVLGDETRSDVWVEDCSIAAINAQLLATDLGLGSCWGQIRNRPHDDTMSAEAYIQHLLGIPSRLRIGMIIAVGYPDEVKKPAPFEKLDQRKIHFNSYR